MHDETLPQDVFKGAKFCSMRITQDTHVAANRVELGTAEVAKSVGN
ncbi:MAG: hypothetical protein U0797_05545 [Gemmataceae bacterium]